MDPHATPSAASLFFSSSFTADAPADVDARPGSSSFRLSHLASSFKLHAAEVSFFDALVALLPPASRSFAQLKRAYNECMGDAALVEGVGIALRMSTRGEEMRACVDAKLWNTLLALVQVRGSTWAERWDSVRVSGGLDPRGLAAVGEARSLGVSADDATHFLADHTAGPTADETMHLVDLSVSLSDASLSDSPLHLYNWGMHGADESTSRLENVSRPLYGSLRALHASDLRGETSDDALASRQAQNRAALRRTFLALHVLRQRKLVALAWMFWPLRDTQSSKDATKACFYALCSDGWSSGNMLRSGKARWRTSHVHMNAAPRRQHGHIGADAFNAAWQCWWLRYASRTLAAKDRETSMHRMRDRRALQHCLSHWTLRMRHWRQWGFVADRSRAWRTQLLVIRTWRAQNAQAAEMWRERYAVAYQRRTAEALVYARQTQRMTRDVMRAWQRQAGARRADAKRAQSHASYAARRSAWALWQQAWETRRRQQYHADAFREARQRRSAFCAAHSYTGLMPPPR
ncbi:hypothetical protein MSPP1_001272 [Malassezia sp. CBS 17886]|nr:hypothetical protein MSPP1_001272 [Malassezia sp. CBS 17886]